jgi:hypothetical protein
METVMSDEQCNLRLQKLELVQEQQAALIDKQGSSLESIQRILLQIRWLFMGVVAAAMLDKLGLWAVVKTLLGG